MEFIRFLTFALASNHETIDHLETLYETKSLTEHSIYDEIHQRTEHLGKKLSNFLKAVNKGHKTN